MKQKASKNNTNNIQIILFTTTTSRKTENTNIESITELFDLPDKEKNSRLLVITESWKPHNKTTCAHLTNTWSKTHPATFQSPSPFTSLMPSLNTSQYFSVAQRLNVSVTHSWADLSPSSLCVIQPLNKYFLLYSNRKVFFLFFLFCFWRIFFWEIWTNIHISISFYFSVYVSCNFHCYVWLCFFLFSNQSFR